ncbi:uncharacterized protein [Parasteatoda tepidariorum]|uniref:uncharacterized protein isoform X2 n=1 Tax=Parasteatoda tepidariorum TaxID=114398 RepID=UPI001C7240CE|nr:uncharacterized protein LOC107451303 isoform X2 [Parasteatoda tepidariorum]XP_015922844.2 uncharacterized protein LOC107451303 isoform X2 [Parasteatoda tepidariorum]XP_015922845.2 uncharacterized protein LOC107451303 isoform X2 [Parasteatoda tepidariorum]XP_042906700.1 uncharacterized protein LOC107451303 isoform X2 [Parasteatoda tepidariorum]
MQNVKVNWEGKGWRDAYFDESGRVHMMEDFQNTADRSMEDFFSINIWKTVSIALTCILAMVLICLTCACCRHYRQNYEPDATAQVSPVINSPVTEHPAPENRRCITTTDMQTGFPVVVDIASVSAQLSQARSEPPSTENQLMSDSIRSAPYGSMDYHDSVSPSAPPPSYLEIVPHSKCNKK